MTNAATQQGARQPGEPVKQKAFPEPGNPAGVDISKEGSDDEPKYVNPRDAVLADMDARIDEERQGDIRANQAELAEASGFEPPVEAGLQSQQQMHPGGENDDLPEDLRNDPLADYIVMDGENAMFRTKVDGQERLIPLDAARTQLQKHVAAEIRLQQVAEERKDLDAREEQIRINEAALAEKLRQPPPGTPPGATSDVSEEDLRKEAQQLVSNLFTGTEAEAVESLTTLLGRTSQVATPQVDPTEIAAQAAKVVRQELSAEEQAEATAQLARDTTEGFKQFSKDFPDILADESLFRYADSLTDKIEAGHPEWTPTQVMAEAGKQTTEWVKSLKGEAPEADPPPGDERTTRKRVLTRMPTPRSEVQGAAEEEQAETPQSVLDDIRASRGQA